IDSTRRNGFVLWSYHLNGITFWCFLFVTLFNLQGARRSRRNIAIILDFIPLVKNFFQKFLTPGPSRIRSNPFRLPHFSFAVKSFFLSLSAAAHHRADSFVRIPNPSHFVNTFFHLFSLPF
ncbi:hypothetical protein, partial [Oscillibacter valericigenes]|uniref:hypothetical protein n=1 Tax=Oscillibacter valericigenes TaxID=351091 RepID=UPI00195D0072